MRRGVECLLSWTRLKRGSTWLDSMLEPMIGLELGPSKAWNPSSVSSWHSVTTYCSTFDSLLASLERNISFLNSR